MQIPSLIFNLVILLALLAWVYRRNALKHMSYTRHFSQGAVFEGEMVDMVERIANRKLLPLPWVRLESILARGLLFDKQANLDIRSGELYQNHISLFSLRPYRQITRRHKVQCVKRGLYHLESATMTAGDPIGIVSTTKRFPLSITLIVYPGTLPLHELPLPHHSWIGDLAVRRWIVEDPFLTSGIREYRSGDPLQAVNWKATARTGNLQVHKKDFTADHRLVICLNFEISELMWKAVIEPERIEEGIRYAATVALYAMEVGIETGLICNGWVKGEAVAPVRISPTGGTAQKILLLETLAKLELETSASMTSLLEEESARGMKDADYLIISCHQGNKLRDIAELLRHSGNGVEWIMIPGGKETQ